MHLAPACLGGVELARPGIVPVVAALAPGWQISLVVVHRILVQVGDCQDDARARYRVMQVIPRPAVGLLAAMAGALQDTLAERLPLRTAQAAAGTEALPVGPDGYRLFLILFRISKPTGHQSLSRRSAFPARTRTTV